ncbi:MAG: permease [Candidatus Aenigmarchaeota archaeon]|nr:permease [Candidatus Aenigmarchaeota archaeon]
MLQEIVDFLFYQVLLLDRASAIAQFFNFFVYDSAKILLLLFGMILAIGYLRSFIPPEKVRDTMSRGRYGIGNIMAALFGAVTPFCSCSSIPLFFGFLRAGVPLGVMFSFLITSPLVNEYLLILIFAYFGWKIAFFYAASGILIGILLGALLGRMGLEKHLDKDFCQQSGKLRKIIFRSHRERLKYGYLEAKSIVRKLWLWILVSVAIGGIIHNYVPQEIIGRVVEGTGALAVPLVVILGVPMYGSCVAILPIAFALFAKGVPLGTALAFMMSVSALSIPEAILLRRAMEWKLIGLFFGLVTVGIVFTGFLFNYLQFLV